MINYYLLTKPGIILGNLITFTAGFLLASKGKFNVLLYIATLIGLSLIMASACVFNNYIDRNLDKKMERTKNRALVKELISGPQAIIFALILGAIGVAILFAFTNFLTVVTALLGFFVYVILYSLWKSHTIYSTAIGSIAGAIPPVVGYVAVSNRFDLGALILFGMLVLWQMPHFFSIALYRFDDYLRADIPVLPIRKGILKTKIHMILYIIAFIIVASLLTYFKYTGYAYLIVVISMGLTWLLLSLKGFGAHNNQLWGRDMFFFSLVLISTICLIIPFDTVHVA